MIAGLIRRWQASTRAIRGNKAPCNGEQNEAYSTLYEAWNPLMDVSREPIYQCIKQPSHEKAEDDKIYEFVISVFTILAAAISYSALKACRMRRSPNSKLKTEDRYNGLYPGSSVLMSFLQLHSVGNSQDHSCWIVSVEIGSAKDAWTSHTSIVLIYMIPCNYNQYVVTVDLAASPCLQCVPLRKTGTLPSHVACSFYNIQNSIVFLFISPFSTTLSSVARRAHGRASTTLVVSYSKATSAYE